MSKKWEISTIKYNCTMPEGSAVITDDSGLLMAVCAPDKAALIAAAPEFCEALKEISRGAGPFSHDPLEHAQNVIERTKNIATKVLAGEEWRDQ